MPGSAFAGLLAPRPGPDPIWVEARTGDGLASVIARKGRADALRGWVSSLHGWDIPDGASRLAAGPVSFVGTAPDTWLAMQDGGGFAWAERLAREFAGFASVSDQCGAYGLVRLGGSAAADVLAKGVFLDLHPAVFSEGAAAATVLAHVNVVLWRRADCFELAVPRSYAADFAHWLTASAVGFGLDVRLP